MPTLVYRDFDQAALDAQYNLRARVPDHPEFFQRWAERSQAARDRLDVHLDLAYGDGPLERLDFFPAPDLAAPILAFIHGGYWQGLDKGDFSWPAGAWVERGVSYASLNYALAPEARIGDMIEQCRRAVLWLWHNAYALGADRDRIVVAGHSAGGHLATMLLATDWTEMGALPVDLIKGACSISGVYDLEPLRLSYQNPVLKLDERAVARTSPIHALPRQAGPLILAVGGAETDEFLRQQEAFAEAWRGAGLTVEAHVLPDLNHYEAVDAIAEPGSPVFSAIQRLLAP